MKNINSIILSMSIIICSSFASCTREFIPDLTTVENKIVVNSLINNEESIRISVTKSLAPGATFKLEELVDASVSLYEDNIYLGALDYEKKEGDPIGYFKSNLVQPSPNKTYEVLVKKEGFDDASAIAKVPEGANITNTSVKFSGDNSYQFNFTINNSPQPDFYYLKMFFRAYVIDENTGERTYIKPEIIEIPEGAIPVGQQYLDNGYVFTDETLKEGENIFTGFAKAGISPNFSENKPEDIQLDTSQLYIHLETLSEDAYKFYYSHAISLISDTDFFSETAPIYSNIKNGLGLFAGIYISEVSVEVE